MFLSKTEYIQITQANQQIPLGFPYLEKTHIVVTTKTSIASTTETIYLGSISFPDDQMVILADVAIGSFVQVRRSTPLSPYVTFFEGNPVLSREANDSNLAIFYILQELADANGSIIGGGGNPTSFQIGYEVHIGGTFDGTNPSRPVVFGRDANLPVSGAVYRTAQATLPTETTTLNLIKNGVVVGQLNVATDGSTTLTLATPIQFVLGDSLVLQPTADNGLRDFGVVFLMETT